MPITAAIIISRLCGIGRSKKYADRLPEGRQPVRNTFLKGRHYFLISQHIQCFSDRFIKIPGHKSKDRFAASGYGHGSWLLF